ncbi:MAG: DUF952 domain-containing protein [Rhodobacteraceae bacterium]|nr:DUF952 domain-containing protein [Paracoccaceae bacterium]
MLIYKIFRAPEWHALRRDGETQGAPVDLADGYIHFSTADQAPETASRHFAGQEDLLLLAIDTHRLGEALKWEPSRGGQLFPHLYGPLRLEHVAWWRPLPMLDTRHLFPEEVAGHVDPTRARFDTFKGLDRDHPIEMLNLVRLRSRAAYPQDHPLADKGLSGADAYASYGRDTGPILAGLGGTILWRGAFETTLIGPDAERWDHAFIARYPSAHAFLAMVTDPAYRKAVVHRQAAVRTSRLIRCAPAPAGGAFG